MKFTVETKKDLTIFKLQESRLDAVIAPELKSEFVVLIEAEGKKYLIIDLSHVEVIDSSGIGTMLMAHRQTADHDGFAAFVGVRSRVRDLLRMTGLDKQLFIFSSIQEAISSIETVDSNEEEKEDDRPTKHTVDIDDEEISDDLLSEIPEISDDLPLDEIATDDIDEPDFSGDEAAEPRKGKGKAKAPRAKKGPKAAKKTKSGKKKSE
jgi:anti-anti-sigma factor